MSQAPVRVPARQVRRRRHGRAPGGSQVTRPRLLHGDNLTVMRTLAAEGFRAHLIYADPPFATGRDFYHEPRDGGPAELAYSDKWPSFEAYIEALRLRVAAARDLLTADGCMFVHVDPTASHYVKVMMDGVFGRAKFMGEIIWKRTGASNIPSKRIVNGHDVLLGYGGTWRAPKTEHDSHGRTADQYSLEDSDGRRFQLTSLCNQNKDRPNLHYELMGHVRTWIWTRERMQKAIDAGLIVQSRPGAVPRFKRYLDEQEGADPGSVWADIPPVQGSAHERTGYPTQKPERLLERIILACSHPGDTVLDPYAGSGVTLRAASRLRRVAVGIDQSPVAIRVATEALARPAQMELL